MERKAKLVQLKRLEAEMASLQAEPEAPAVQTSGWPMLDSWDRLIPCHGSTEEVTS